MAKGVKRRRTRGSAWHWQQTDGWSYTPPGTKNRVTLADENGRRIRGKDNKKLAELALARVKASGEWRPTSEPSVKDEWLVAKVCSVFIQNCEHRAANGTVTGEYRDEVVRYLNAFSEYSGGLPVSQLKKGHVEYWVESHKTWRSPVTCRNAIAIVQAAFNYAQDEHEVRNPIRGLKKPPSRPRLHSSPGSVGEMSDFVKEWPGLRPDGFIALVPIPKEEEKDAPTRCGRYALRSWPLGRRSGRFSPPAYPPPRP